MKKKEIGFVGTKTLISFIKNSYGPSILDRGLHNFYEDKK